MNLWEILVIALSLSMDAFAVSVCKGAAARRVLWKHVWLCGGYFGLFQAVTPLVGFALGTQLQNRLAQIDHWVAFGLLVLVGGNMIREAVRKNDRNGAGDSFRPSDMLPLAIATSIDAFAVGITFATLRMNGQILVAALSIGMITFALSAAGVKTGNLLGLKYRAKAEGCGGLLLILMGCRILLRDLGIFG